VFVSVCGLASKESPEKSAIDSDKAAWNKVVKAGIVTAIGFAWRKVCKRDNSET